MRSSWVVKSSGVPSVVIVVKNCVVFGGGTFAIDQDGNLTGTGGFSYRAADGSEDPAPLDAFTMDLQKGSLEEIRSFAMPPTP